MREETGNRDQGIGNSGKNLPQRATPNTQYLRLLTPLSWLYRGGLAAYLLPYKIGIRKRHRLPCRVVSVGNLTFGGTGKSPMVRAICEELTGLGIRAAVLSRGHGGKLCSVGGLVSDGNRRLMDACDSGDEPALLADSLPGVPVAIGKDRRKSGGMIVERFEPDVIVLDDGMQYWQLHRDVEIVLVSAAAPFGMGRVLPAGDMREPPSGLGRADVVIVTGAEAVDEDRAREVKADMVRRAPHGKVFVARRDAVAVIDAGSGERLPVDALKGMSVVAVSGIAKPHSFEEMLARCGAKIAACVRFGDHCAYSKSQMEIVRSAMESTRADVVVTTAKDAVKLQISDRTLILDIAMVVDNMEELIRIVAGSAKEARVEPAQA
jgi:tetraacyldisaccharide 4'-kinase